MTASVGRMTVSVGRMTASVGRMTASVGRITASVGRMTASVGRMTASVGRITARRPLPNQRFLFFYLPVTCLDFVHYILRVFTLLARTDKQRELAIGDFRK